MGNEISLLVRDVRLRVRGYVLAFPCRNWQLRRKSARKVIIHLTENNCMHRSHFMRPFSTRPLDEISSISSLVVSAFGTDLNMKEKAAFNKCFTPLAGKLWAKQIIACLTSSHKLDGATVKRGLPVSEGLIFCKNRI